MVEQFTPVKLVKDGKNRVAKSAVEETELRFNGWAPAPAETPKPKN